MAVRAFADFGIVLTFLKMTDETGAVCDCNVFSLNDLGVTACAAELFASFQVSEMNFVVKNDFVETNLSFQKSLVVATLAKAGFIRNFGPGF